MADTMLDVHMEFDEEMNTAVANMAQPQIALVRSLNLFIEWLRGRVKYAGSSPSDNFITRHFKHGNVAAYKWRTWSRPYIMLRRPGLPMLVQSKRLMKGVLNFRKRVGYPASMVEVMKPDYANIHHQGGFIRVPEIKPKYRKWLRWFDKYMVPHFSKKTSAHTVVFPKRDFFSVSRFDQEWHNQAMSEILGDVFLGKE